MPLYNNILVNILTTKVKLVNGATIISSYKYPESGNVDLPVGSIAIRAPPQVYKSKPGKRSCFHHPVVWEVHQHKIDDLLEIYRFHRLRLVSAATSPLSAFFYLKRTYLSPPYLLFTTYLPMYSSPRWKIKSNFRHYTTEP